MARERERERERSLVQSVQRSPSKVKSLSFFFTLGVVINVERETLHDHLARYFLTFNA